MNTGACTRADDVDSDAGRLAGHWRGTGGSYRVDGDNPEHPPRPHRLPPHRGETLVLNADLHSCNLTDVTLAGHDLNHANLRDANLTQRRYPALT
ncbi:pentapeptide repeat-containing protein [Rhodococcus cerastii]|nr:pentapeptide repeat-containing protein [Rhodococcus cerastii]